MRLALSKRKIFRIISRGIIYVLVFSLLCPQQALASRSSAGGGKIAKPDWGRVATNVGIAIGSAIVMNSLGNAWKAAQPVAAGAQTGAQVGTQAMTIEGMNCLAQAWLAEPAVDFVSTVGTQAMTIEGMGCVAQAWLAEPAIDFVSTANTSLSLIDRVGSTIGNIGSGIKNLVTNTAGGGVVIDGIPARPLAAAWNSMTNLETVMPAVVKGYATYTATNQVGRAVGMAGSYYGWSPKTTFIISNVAVGATAGFLNPEVSLAKELDTKTTVFTNDKSLVDAGNVAGASQGETIYEYASDPVQAAADYAEQLKAAGIGAPVPKTIITPGRLVETKTGQISIIYPQQTSGGFVRSIEAPEGYARVGVAQAQASIVGITETVSYVTGRSNLIISTVPGQIGSIAASNMFRGALVGGLGNLGSSLAIVAIDGDKIDKGKSPGTVAQIAGMTAGFMSTNFTRELVKPTHENIDAINGRERAEKAVMKDPQWPHLQRQLSAFEGEIEDYSIFAYGGNIPERETDPYLDFLRDMSSDITQDMNNLQFEKYGRNWTYYRAIYNKGKVDFDFNHPIRDDVFEPEYLSSRYRQEQLARNIFKYTDTRANLTLGHLAKATLLEPFNSQNWPVLASRSIGIWAQNSLSEKNERWAPLVNGLAQSVSYPIFSGLSNIYGIDAVRYFGKGLDKLEADLRYVYGVNSIGHDFVGTEFAQEADKFRQQNEAGTLLDKEYAQELAKLSIMKEGMSELIEDYHSGEIPYSEFNDQFNKLRKEGKPLAYSLVDPKGRVLAEVSPEQLSEELHQNLPPELVPQGPLERERLSQKTENLASLEGMTWGKVRRNQALMQEGMWLEQLMPLDVFTSEQALNNIGTNKNQLFWNYVQGGVMAGVFDSVISGLTEAAVSKWTEKSSATGKMLGLYAANMLTAVIRGYAWDAGWDRVTNEWDWHKKWDFVMPEQYTEPQKIIDTTGKEMPNPKFDFIQYKESETNFDNEMLRFQRFVKINGFYPGYGLNYHRERPKWDFAANNGKGDWVKDPRWVATLIFLDKKPSLEYSIEASIRQANTEYLSRALSFGIPMIREQGTAGYGIEPRAISSLNFMDYTQYLSYLSGMGLASALTSSVNQANLSTISNNIGGALLQLPGVAKTFNIQPERLVLTATQRTVRVPVVTTTIKEREDFKAAAYQNGLLALGSRERVFDPIIYKEYLTEEDIKGPNAEPGGYEHKITLGEYEASRSISYGEIVTPYLDAAGANILDEERIITEEHGIKDYYLLTDVPKMPYTIQSIRFEGGKGLMMTRFWAPFPNPLYGIRPQTGEGEYLRRKGIKE